MQTRIWNTLTKTEQQQALTRPAISASTEIKQAVENILNLVKSQGDRALFELTEKFDKVKLESLIVSQTAIQQAGERLSSELKQAIQTAKQNIATFHQAQQPQTVDKHIRIIMHKDGIFTLIYPYLPF